MIKFIKANWILLFTLALALVFRFWQITRLPGGLFPDEAANGLDINSILSGDLQPFYERGNGREALFFYVLAAVVAVFGRGHWQHHAVSAGFGFAAVLATYFLTKRLFGKRTALLATFFMSVASYATLISRTAFRANTVPFPALLTILFFVKALQTKQTKTRIWSGAAAGLFFALGFYTYTSFRMMLPLLFAFGVVLILGNRDKLAKYIKAYRGAASASAAAFLAGIAWRAP